MRRCLEAAGEGLFRAEGSIEKLDFLEFEAGLLYPNDLT